MALKLSEVGSGFDADFTMGQRSHLVAWLSQKSVIFGAAFSHARLGSAGARGDKVAGDSQEHIIDDSGDGARFVLRACGGIGKLAEGIQNAFEGDPVQVNIMDQGGFLHEAANEVVGYEVHEQFTFDHVGRFAAQDVHVEVDFDFAKVEFAPQRRK